MDEVLIGSLCKLRMESTRNGLKQAMEESGQTGRKLVITTQESNDGSLDDGSWEAVRRG